MKFAYPAEKFQGARRALMLPFPGGMVDAIAGAFHECSLGLHDIRDDDLESEALAWVRQLRDLMDTTGLEDSTGRGLWVVKAERLNEEQLFSLSRVVDELANWFDARLASGD